jgi:SAM-dependent methyltransferase
LKKSRKTEPASSVSGSLANRNAGSLALLYTSLAEWWPLLSAPEDYEEEAGFYGTLLRGHRDVLELGAGGGNNAFHLKRHFQMTLSDPAPGMLAHSRRLNPECEHIEADMRTLRLGRTFDAVFVHDAICYMTTPVDLRSALETAYLHLREGGIALFVPDCVHETFEPSTECGGHDGADGRSLRYLEWCWDPDPHDSQCVADYIYALRSADGAVQTLHDRHIEGLFTRAEWLSALRDVGFAPRIETFAHSEVERPIEVFVGVK